MLKVESRKRCLILIFFVFLGVLWGVGGDYVGQRGGNNGTHSTLVGGLLGEVGGGTVKPRVRRRRIVVWGSRNRVEVLVVGEG